MAKEIQRYPLVVHRGTPPDNESKLVLSTEQEAEALSTGWGLVAPKIHTPEPEPPPPSVEEQYEAVLARLELIEQRLDAIEQRRMPGRPRKDATE